MIDRVLFLDFDGVLNTTSTFRGMDLHPRLVENVGTVVRKSGAAVVVSSDWRHYESLDSLRQLLAPCVPADRVLGVTPELKTRGLEIARWLMENRVRKARIAVLDDNHQGRFDMRPVARHLVKTDARIGLDAVGVARAIKLLREGPEWQSI